MSSFSKVAQCYAQELDSTGQLLPVSGPLDSSKFLPLHLVQRVEKGWFKYKKIQYHPTSVDLGMVLVDGDTSDIVQKVSPVGTGELSSCTAVAVNTDLKIPVLDAGAEASHTRTRSVESTDLEKVEVCPDSLVKKLENSKFNMNHWKMKALRNASRVCVVIEAVRIRNKMKLMKDSSSKLSLMVKPSKLTEVGAKVEGQRNLKFAYEEGTVLACKAYELNISTKGEFQDEVYFSRSAYEEINQGVVDYMQSAFSEFLNLEQPARAELWTLLSELLLDREALTALDSFVDDALQGDAEKLSLDRVDEKLRHPVQDLLDYLEFFPDGNCNHKLFRPVMSLIHVLDELSDRTLNLISGLDKEAYRQQIELVTIVLRQADGSLSLDNPDWTARYSKENLCLVRELLSDCGLNMCDEQPSLKFKLSSKQEPVLYAMYVVMTLTKFLKTE
ncbi:uncharacterized protein LOC127435880 isoform X2 [Myxocyprinus asiaticus]|uniref:uncharacterized protein LOC127435880 isoform X2 n=1 Tax=Myxocyprinus asiaticus TaxID=70543 RepID=UPI002223ECEB|nr:uncharacterized protein LOC127435880 isoform X2 [Myxocyprinus asiaticus]